MKYLASLFIIFSLTGCATEIKQEPKDTSEAHRQFIDQTEKDLGVTTILKQVDNTLWIYVPFEDDLLALKGTKDGPMMIKEVSETPAIHFLDAKFENNSFVIDYDIGTMRSYPKSFGYASTYSEAFQSVQQGLYMALLGAFDDVRDDPIHKKPEFIYMIVADMKTGLEVESLIYFDDLKHMMHAQEEFQKRVVSEVRGHEQIIGDTEGKHLVLTPITLPEFLAKQMKHRINFKYTRSTFPPTEDALTEVQMQIKTVLELYEFNNFDNIVINDLAKELSTEVTEDDLENIKMEGRLIKINFNQ